LKSYRSFLQIGLSSVGWCATVLALT
jgi:hypothetical protein